VRRALEEQGARNINVEVAEDDTDMSISWTIDAADRDDASVRGHLVLDAVTADEYLWQLNVAQYFVTG
jgi:hypothetical protein